MDRRPIKPLASIAVDVARATVERTGEDKAELEEIAPTDAELVEREVERRLEALVTTKGWDRVQQLTAREVFGVEQNVTRVMSQLRVKASKEIKLETVREHVDANRKQLEQDALLQRLRAAESHSVSKPSQSREGVAGNKDILGLEKNTAVDRLRKAMDDKVGPLDISLEGLSMFSSLRLPGRGGLVANPEAPSENVLAGAPQKTNSVDTLADEIHVSERKTCWDLDTMNESRKPVYLSSTQREGLAELKRRAFEKGGAYLQATDQYHIDKALLEHAANTAAETSVVEQDENLPNEEKSEPHRGSVASTVEIADLELDSSKETANSNEEAKRTGKEDTDQSVPRLESHEYFHRPIGILPDSTLYHVDWFVPDLTPCALDTSAPHGLEYLDDGDMLRPDSVLRGPDRFGEWPSSISGPLIQTTKLNDEQAKEQLCQRLAKLMNGDFKNELSQAKSTPLEVDTDILDLSGQRCTHKLPWHHNPTELLVDPGLDIDGTDFDEEWHERSRADATLIQEEEDLILKKQLPRLLEEARATCSLGNPCDTSDETWVSQHLHEVAVSRMEDSISSASHDTKRSIHDSPFAQKRLWKLCELVEEGTGSMGLLLRFKHLSNNMTIDANSENHTWRSLRAIHGCLLDHS